MAQSSLLFRMNAEASQAPHAQTRKCARRLVAISDPRFAIAFADSRRFQVAILLSLATDWKYLPPGRKTWSSVDVTRAIEPGTVVAVSKDDFSVFCGDGTVLRVTEVQPEGRRAMSVRDYLNGPHIAIGMLLD